MTAGVVVITRDQDLTADLVILELAKRNVRVARFDLADVPERIAQDARLAGGSWSGTWTNGYWTVALEDVKSVWWRKPAAYRPHPALDTAERQWAAAEAEAGFGGVLAALPWARWVNDPFRNKAADHKPAQLTVAARYGLAVPETLLTNDPQRARDFCRSHPAGVICKPLRGGPGRLTGERVALWADTVTAEDITPGVARTIHQFQARVPCAYPVRMTVVGRRLFAARLRTPPGAPVDWRAVHGELSYSPVDVPPDVAGGVHRMMDHFGLVYAAPDWIVTPDGTWTFTGDLNPNGQWGWLHEMFPIAAALADELAPEHP